MSCNYIYKSGKNKGSVCDKENCKRHVIKQKNEEPENKVYKYALKIKEEIDDLYSNKKKAKIFYISTNETKEEVITEKINPGYEAQIYVMTRFLQLKKESLSDFKRIIYPVSEFKELDAELYCMNDMQFLYKFADVKTQL
jgi:hypothetical protein